MVDDSQRYLRSSFYEKLVEHVFIAEVLQEAWFGLNNPIEVLRAEVDASGYDLVLDCKGVIRHVQLKTSATNQRKPQKVNIALAEKPSGCIVWIIRNENRSTHRMYLTYRFFGGEPKERLPELAGFRTAKHSKGDGQGTKAERPSIRVVPGSRFSEEISIRELLHRLFDLPV